MLPDSYHLPARLSKPLVYVGVALSIRLELVHPEVGVLPCRTMMIRASMPVATVHEHSYPGSSEHYISCPPHIGHWTCRYTVPEPESVQL